MTCSVSSPGLLTLIDPNGFTKGKVARLALLKCSLSSSIVKSVLIASKLSSLSLVCRVSLHKNRDRSRSRDVDGCEEYIWLSNIGLPCNCATKIARGLAPPEAVVGVEGELSASPAAINVRNLGLSMNGDKGKVVVLKECSLTVPEGQLWMLLGPNGCGKSTLLKALAGLLRPNQGKMYVVGPRSFVFQNPDHQVVMPTAEADVAFGLGRFDLSEEEVKTRVYTSLEAVGMREYGQRPIQTLSGGQKQRVAIAGALAESSRVLLLDELTTFLDEADQMGVLEAVRKVVGGSVTALWVTHRLEELEFADGAIYMENGRVVLSGSVEDVKRYIQKQQEESIKNGVLR